MTEAARIPVRQLRNHTSDVLRRVEAGETVEVTVNDRPVALLIPRPGRPTSMSKDEFFANVPLADPRLASDLSDIMSATTDDIQDPWSR